MCAVNKCPFEFPKLKNVCILASNFLCLYIFSTLMHFYYKAICCLIKTTFVCLQQSYHSFINAYYCIPSINIGPKHEC